MPGELFKKIVNPLTNKPREVADWLANKIDPLEGQSGGDRGMIRPAIAGGLQGVGQMMSEATSPLSLGLAVAGPAFNSIKNLAGLRKLAPMAGRVEDAGADFLGWQEGGGVMDDFPLFNLKGGPNSGSTVGIEDLEKLGIKIPTHPPNPNIPAPNINDVHYAERMAEELNRARKVDMDPLRPAVGRQPSIDQSRFDPISGKAREILRPPSHLFRK